MALFNFRKKNEVRSAGEVTITTNEQSDAAIGLVFGKNFTSDAYSRNLSAVYRATNLIADSLASLPCYLYKKSKVDGMKVKYTEHPVFDLLLNRPNKFLTSHDYIKAMATDLMLKGNAYSIIHRGPDNKPTYIEYVPASKVTITKKYKANGELDNVLYNVVGRSRMMEMWEVIHIKQNLSEDGVEGISILTYAARSLKICQSAENSVKNSYENGGVLRGILSVKQGMLTSKAKQDMREAWRTSVGGTNSGGVAVLSGIEQYTPIGQNNEEMELLGSRVFNVSEVARFWGVNPILLYDLSHSTYSSADAAHLHLLTDTLNDYIYKFEAEFENKLLSKAELADCEIKFDTTQFLRADQKTQIGIFREMFNMGTMSPNEIREALDMPKIEDGDLYVIQAQYCTLKNAHNIGAEATGPIKVDNKLKIGEQKETEEEK